MNIFFDRHQKSFPETCPTDPHAVSPENGASPQAQRLNKAMERNTKNAIVTGITGQDGAYLTQLLLNHGYTVHGAYRRTSSANFWRMEELGILGHENLHLVENDITDLGVCISLVQKIQPVEIYNLAAQSFVGASFEQPNTTAQIINPAIK